MSQRIYTLPGSDVEVTCEYRITRLQDLILGDCYVGDQTLDVDALFVKAKPNPFTKEEKFYSLRAHLQDKLEHNALEILGDEFQEAAE